jgi:hypothetical protein
MIDSFALKEHEAKGVCQIIWLILGVTSASRQTDNRQSGLKSGLARRGRELSV